MGVELHPLADSQMIQNNTVKVFTSKHNRKTLGKIIFISQSIVFQLKLCRYNWEIGADWENNIICHLSGLVNFLLVSPPHFVYDFSRKKNNPVIFY